MQTPKRLPIEAVIAGLRPHFHQRRGCLYPGSNTCNAPVIASHTIQRGAALRAIAGHDNHVLTFYPRQSNDVGQQLTIKRRGWREASTFFGFCSHHDAEVFAPLETSPFSATDEQLFLLAYRAHCHEFYQKLSMLDSEESFRNLGARAAPKEMGDIHRRRSDAIFAGAEFAARVLEARKCVMDSQLLSRKFSGWSSRVFQFDGPLSVTGTGAITPNCDFEQNALQVLHDRTSPNQYLYFAVIPCDDRVAFTFVWNSEDKAPARFVASIANLPIRSMPHILLQIVFAFCENTYFSETWWNSLDSSCKLHIRLLAESANPYYSPLEFFNEGVSPWIIRE